MNAERVVIEDPEKTEGNLNKSVQKAIKNLLFVKLPTVWYLAHGTHYYVPLFSENKLQFFHR